MSTLTWAGLGEVKWPPPSPSRIDTLLSRPLAVAKSSLPSPLKSPTATAFGLLPTLICAGVGDVKWPLPSPRRIETVPPPKLATTTSSLLSPLKSPTATDLGFVPTPISAGRAEVATAVTQPDRYAVGAKIGSHDVELAITVEVADRHRIGVVADAQ